MDYLITTILPNLKEVNTIIVGTSKERIETLYLELLNQYSVFSFQYSTISLYEKSRFFENSLDRQEQKPEHLYKTLKPYERKENNTSSFPTSSPANNSSEMG